MDTYRTLITIAELVGVYKRNSLTTSILGKKLSVSQQTASRVLIELEGKGLIIRAPRNDGIEIELTSIAKKIILDEKNRIEKIYKKNIQEKIMIKGKVVRGMGEGAYHIKVYKTKLKHILGYEAFDGTLNVKLLEMDKVKLLASATKLRLEEFSSKDRSFGGVNCHSIILQKTGHNKKVSCHLIIPDRTSYGNDIAEIISKHNLRKYLKITEGDEVVIFTK